MAKQPSAMRRARQARYPPDSERLIEITGSCTSRHDDREILF